MIEQGGQVRERRTVAEPGLDRIEMRPLQAANQHGVGRHAAMVPPAPASVEVQNATSDPVRGSSGVQALDWDALICSGLAAADLTHEQACELMVDDDGKPLDPSLWNRMRRRGNLPLTRMWKLPLAFRQHFVFGLAEATGVQVSHADIETLAVRDLLLACVRFTSVKMAAPGPVLVERRRA